MPQYELTALYNIKQYRGTICTKNAEKHFFINVMYIQSTVKRKQQRSTDKDTTSKLEHFKPPKTLGSLKPLTVTHTQKVKQYSFTLSVNIHAIQLALSTIHTLSLNLSGGFSKVVNSIGQRCELRSVCRGRRGGGLNRPQGQLSVWEIFWFRFVATVLCGESFSPESW